MPRASGATNTVIEIRAFNNIAIDETYVYWLERSVRALRNDAGERLRRRVAQL